MTVVFEMLGPVGLLTLEPLDVDAHTDLLHGWVTHPRSVFWGMQDADPAAVRAEYTRIQADPHHHAWLGRLDGSPLFLTETYDPAHSALAAHYPVAEGDVGMHVLVAPPGRPRHGVTSAVIRAVVTFALRDPAARRVVVEPDMRNDAIAARNAEVGFVVDRLVTLPDKVARLSFCMREAFVVGEIGTPTPAAETEIDRCADHLNVAVMADAQRRLVAKAIAEFAHERLIAPQPDAPQPDAPQPDSDRDAGYLLPVPGGCTYRFRARRYRLEHWVVDPSSIERTVHGRPAPIDAQQLVAELADPLGIPAHLLGTYLEEIAATLAGMAWQQHHVRDDAQLLAHSDFQTIEAGMTAGHPGFVANRGRIGFSLTDHRSYAPEAGRPVRLLWLAVRRAESDLTAGRGVDESTFHPDQLGGDNVDRFHRRLREQGLDPDGYRLLPVHPWQWEHRIAVSFAADVARGSLVPVGYGPDRYRAQQSIRTFFDIDRPDRHYIKTALSIQNMGFPRGLSPAYMAATPAINDWVADLVAADPTLAECRFGVLRELATTGYTGDAYHRAGGARGVRMPQQKMIAALWRESPVPRLAPGERLATMAALLHVDRAGRALIGELIKASGRTADEWLGRYLAAYLRPLVHCLLQYDLAFMPHGENVILVLDGHLPGRVLIKDIGEEVAVMNAEIPLPRPVQRIRVAADDDLRALAIHTDVLDGFLRHLGGILDGAGLLPQQQFWRLVADCLDRHADEHPDLAGRLDLRRPAFAHSCLNRLQLRNTLQMVDLTDQPGSLMFAGELVNPVAREQAVVR